jgi:hypothetical protein
VHHNSDVLQRQNEREVAAGALGAQRSHGYAELDCWTWTATTRSAKEEHLLVGDAMLAGDAGRMAIGVDI